MNTSRLSTILGYLVFTVGVVGFFGSRGLWLVPCLMGVRVVFYSIVTVPWLEGRKETPPHVGYL